jgi:hypothetical protein
VSYVCTYELRERDDAVTSTGRLTLEEAPVVGESLRLGETETRIEDVRGAGNGELHLTLRAG